MKLFSPEGSQAEKLHLFMEGLMSSMQVSRRTTGEAPLGAHTRQATAPELTG